MKNAPAILTGLSVAGFISTVVMVAKSAPLAELEIETEKINRASCTEHPKYDIPVTIVDIAKLTWKLYLPAAVVGAASIGCILGINSVHTSRQAALASAYSVAEAALKEYQSKVIEVIGSNKERQITDAIDQDRLLANPTSTSEVIFTKKGETLCFDSYSGRYFKSDIELLRRKENEINSELLRDEFVTLNSVYIDIGLPPIKVGWDVGWVQDGSLVNFGFGSHLTSDGEPCLVLNFDITPKHI